MVDETATTIIIFFLAPAYHPHTKGRVGPVYTFVKTDPKVRSWIRKTRTSRNAGTLWHALLSCLSCVELQSLRELLSCELCSSHHVIIWSCSCDLYHCLEIAKGRRSYTIRQMIQDIFVQTDIANIEYIQFWQYSFDRFLATLVALHFAPVSKSVSRSFELA